MYEKGDVKKGTGKGMFAFRRIAKAQGTEALCVLAWLRFSSLFFVFFNLSSFLYCCTRGGGFIIPVSPNPPAPL